MCAVYTQRVEDEQIQQLTWVQDRLSRCGIRTLLVRHLRLTLVQNRYDPPELNGPVLLAGQLKISVRGGYHVQAGDGRSLDFADAADAASYVSEQARPVS